MGPDSGLLVLVALGFTVTNLLLFVAVIMLVAIRFQIGRFAADAESEKGARVRANVDTMAALKAIHQDLKLGFHLYPLDKMRQHD